MSVKVLAVERFEQGQVLLLRQSTQAGRGIEIHDPRLGAPQQGSLKQRRHEAAGPIRRSVDRDARGIGQDDIGRQFLRLVAQSIDHPGAERGAADDAGNAAVEIADRNFVAVVAGVHRADDANVVDDAGGVAGAVRRLRCPTAPWLANFQGLAKQFAAGTIDEAEVDLADRRSVPSQPGQFGLGIQQVDVRRSAVHEERNHRLGLRRKMGRLGAASRAPANRDGLAGGSASRMVLVVEQPGQGHAADAHGAWLAKNVAPRLGRGACCRTGASAMLSAVDALTESQLHVPDLIGLNAGVSMISFTTRAGRPSVRLWSRPL